MPEGRKRGDEDGCAPGIELGQDDGIDDGPSEILGPSVGWGVGHTDRERTPAGGEIVRTAPEQTNTDSQLHLDHWT